MGIGRAIDIGVIARDVEAHAKGEVQLPLPMACHGHYVAHRGLASIALALPALVLVETYAVLVDIGREAYVQPLICRALGATEIVARLEFVVAYLEELVLAPPMIIRTHEPCAVGEMTPTGIELQTYVPHRRKTIVGHVEEVVEHVGAHCHERYAMIPLAFVLYVGCQWLGAEFLFGFP